MNLLYSPNSAIPLFCLQHKKRGQSPFPREPSPAYNGKGLDIFRPGLLSVNLFIKAQDSLAVYHLQASFGLFSRFAGLLGQDGVRSKGFSHAGSAPGSKS